MLQRPVASVKAKPPPMQLAGACNNTHVANRSTRSVSQIVTLVGSKYKSTIPFMRLHTGLKPVAAMLRSICNSCGQYSSTVFLSALTQVLQIDRRAASFYL